MSALHDDDPSLRVRAVFADIHATRMADLAICHPGLHVATAGFRRWDGGWVGGLLTPWCMNLLRLADSRGDGEPPPGATVWRRFPSGEYPFVAHHDAALGVYLACSLFSPLFEFADQREAEAVLAAAVEALFAPADPAADDRARREADRLAGRPSLAAPLSRRGFLRGAWGPSAR